MPTLVDVACECPCGCGRLVAVEYEAVIGDRRILCAACDDDRHLPLERCIDGKCFECPDGWHYGDDLPCPCTPDCVLEATA